MRVLASEIIRRSLDLADIQNTDFLSHEEKTKYLNEAWINLYQLIINKGVKQFVKEVELQNGSGGTDFTEFLIPSDLWQVCSLKNKYSGSIIPRHAESESIASNSWEIVNDRIRLYGAMTSPLLLTYWAVPTHVTFPNKSISIENKPIEMGISNSILYKDGELKNALTGEDLGDLSDILKQDHYNIGNELCLISGNYAQEYFPAMCTSYGYNPTYYIADGSGSNKALTDYYSVSYLNPIWSKLGDGYVVYNQAIWRCNGIFSKDTSVLLGADSSNNPVARQDLGTIGTYTPFTYTPDSSLKLENRPALLGGTFHPIKWASGKTLLQFDRDSYTYLSYDYNTDRGLKRITGFGGTYTPPSSGDIFTTTALSNIYCTDISNGDYFLKKDGDSWLILDENDEFVELPSYFTVSGNTLYDEEFQEEYTLYSVTNAYSVVPNTNIWFRKMTNRDYSNIYTTGDNLLLEITSSSSPYFYKYTNASSGTTLYFITDAFNYNTTDIPDFFEDIGTLTLAIYQEFNIQSNATDTSTKICAPVASFDAERNVTLGESILGKFGLFKLLPSYNYNSQVAFGTLGLAVQGWEYTVTDYENTPLGSSYGSPYFSFYKDSNQEVVSIYDENYNLYGFQSIGTYTYKLLPANALATGLFAQDVYSVSSNYLSGFNFLITDGSADDPFAIYSYRAVNENFALRIHQENTGVESSRNVFCTFQLLDIDGNVVAESETFQMTGKDWMYSSYMPIIRSTDRFDGKLTFNMFAAYETTAYPRGVSLLTVDIENNEWEIIPIDLPNGLFETFTKYGPVITRGSNKTLYSNIPDTEFNFPNDIYYQVLSADLAVRYAMKQNIDASGLQALYQTMVTTFENTLEQDSGYNRMQNIYR